MPLLIHIESFGVFSRCHNRHQRENIPLRQKLGQFINFKRMLWKMVYDIYSKVMIYNLFFSCLISKVFSMHFFCLFVCFHSFRLFNYLSLHNEQYESLIRTWTFWKMLFGKFSDQRIAGNTLLTCRLGLFVCLR